MFEWPVAQKRQWPQTGRNEVTTWSPSLTRETPGPTFSMMPAPSWPPTIGKRGHDVAVAQVLVGVAQARRHPADQHLPCLGSSRSSSAISQSRPVSRSIAALVFTRLLLSVTPTARSYPLVVSRALHRGARRAAVSGWRRRPSRGRRRRPAAAVAIEDRRVPELVLGRVDELELEDLLDARVAAGDLEGRAQPRGADLRLLRAVAGGQVAELGQVEVHLAPVGRAQRLALGELVERAGQARELADRHVVGLPAATCGALVNW